MFSISVNFKDPKKVDHILESSLDFYALYVVYQLSEIKDDIEVVSQFPCLLGHPVHCEFSLFQFAHFQK